MLKKFTFFFILVILAATANLFSQNTHLKAVSDTVDLIPGIPVTINLLANDIIPPGDSIIVEAGDAECPRTYITKTGMGGLNTYKALYWGNNSICEGYYILWNKKDTTKMDTSLAKIVFRVHDHSYDSLDINNINAWFIASGCNFLGLVKGAHFEVPKGSGKSTIFNSDLWIAGLGQDSTLYLSSYQFATTGGIEPTQTDYKAGPVMDSASYSIYTDTVWNKVWKVKRSDIAYHLAHYHDQGYIPIPEIATWPGNGNTSLGQMQSIAPFFDANGNNIYEPMQGDYPLIRGDESIFFVFNDDIPSQRFGRNLRVEVHAMAYGFDMPEDSAFKNAIFVNYKVFNLSQRTYYRTAFGMFADFDIGYPYDDYFGCDVQRGSFFGYNGTPVDGSGQSYAYGSHPPAQAVTILAGPKMDADGIDNPKNDGSGHQLCNASINGMNFGDSIVDNERFGMTFSNTINSVIDPLRPFHCYSLLYNRFYDSVPIKYEFTGSPCKFMFPGNSDTLNWGTACAPPGVSDANWSMVTSHNPPSDYKGLGSSGPFTFKPGDVEDFDIAYVFARDYTGDSSVTKLGQMIDTIRKSWITNKLPNGESFSESVQNLPSTSSAIRMYPNPANNSVTFDFGRSINDIINISLLSVKGDVLLSRAVNLNSNKFILDISNIPAGLYIVQISSSRESQTKKLVIIR